SDLDCLLVRAESNPMSADVLADAAYLTGGIEIVSARSVEIDSALPIDDQVIQAPETPAVDVIRKNFALRRQHADRRRVLTLGRLAAGIGARPLHGQDAPLRIDRHRPCPVRVLKKDGG